MHKARYRVVILGSGPAGLTAALYASRANLEPLVVEGGGGEDATDVPGGQLMMTTDVDNYPGFPEGILGPEMMDRFRRQAGRFGTEFASGAVRKVDLGRRPFTLSLDEGEVQAETLIVATGARARWLGLPEAVFRTNIGGVWRATATDSSQEQERPGGGAATPRWRRPPSSPSSPKGHRRAPARYTARVEDHAGPRLQQPQDRLDVGQRDREDPGRAGPGRHGRART
jgi:hypothetical protein